jgi:UPF0489 domain
MHYRDKQVLTEPVGNNAFAWKERITKCGWSPSLVIPSLIDGTLDDIKIWSDIVFEEIEDGEIRSCVGLENFVQLSKNIVVFDNHNHALYYWIDAMRRWIIQLGCELIHIDEHSDLWSNDHILDLEKAIKDESYAWEFSNIKCNVGNYILPGIKSGLIGKMIRIENEYQIDASIDYIPGENSILNLDLDIFAPELDHIPSEKKIKIIKNLLKKVKYVTIATSPFFIEPWQAIHYLHQIMRK